MITQYKNATSLQVELRTKSGKVFQVKQGETVTSDNDPFTHQKTAIDSKFKKMALGYFN
jgi:hypothetical protein